MKTCTVVLSGGQDSTACLFWAVENFDEVHAVTFDYGQRHSIEIESATKVAVMASVKTHEIIKVPEVLKSRSPLVDMSQSLERYSDFGSMDEIIGDRVELTFVPMRNAFFLTLAANIALSKDCYHLVTGVCEADNANYPDCRLSFIESQEFTINQALGLRDRFRIHTPLIAMSKAESIKLAQSLSGCMEAMAYSHTCYSGECPPCGTCHSCVLRAEGFKEAGVRDPLIERCENENITSNS